jgi:hypothetical protein
MARDLIPPPSPAGRPSPDPSWERSESAPTGGADAPAEATSPPAPAGPAPFRGRFGFVMGALLGIGACAAIGFGLLLAAGPPKNRIKLAENWSSWQPPTSDASTGAQDIAAHVAPEYRRDAAHQLVAVEGGPLQLEGTPVTVALRPDDGTIRDLGSDGVLYTLHGAGAHGELTAGKPSVERHALLRREALELALYSFRYLDGIDEVVALLPPTNPKASAKASKGAAKKAAATEKPQQQAVLYRAGDLRRELESPLSRTLRPERLTPDSLSSTDLHRIDTLTLSNLFLASYQLAPDQRLFLLLARPGS